MRQWPAPLKLEMTFRLQDARLQQSLKITHLGDKRIPFGIGYHTWFMIDGEPERWNLSLPADSIYELDSELLTSGNLLPLGNLQSLHGKMNLQGKNLDTVLRIGEGQPAEALLLRDDGYGVRYSADQDYFRHWVVYTKGEAEQFLCIEPYTWLPNAPNLAKDASFTGIIALDPGRTVVLDSALEIIYPSL
jgi:aldose 1-epimerase